MLKVALTLGAEAVHELFDGVQAQRTVVLKVDVHPRVTVANLVRLAQRPAHHQRDRGAVRLETGTLRTCSCSATRFQPDKKATTNEMAKTHGPVQVEVLDQLLHRAGRDQNAAGQVGALQLLQKSQVQDALVAQVDAGAESELAQLRAAPADGLQRRVVERGQAAQVQLQKKVFGLKFWDD